MNASEPMNVAQPPHFSSCTKDMLGWWLWACVFHILALS